MILLLIVLLGLTLCLIDWIKSIKGRRKQPFDPRELARYMRANGIKIVDKPKSKPPKITTPNFPAGTLEVGVHTKTVKYPEPLEDSGYIETPAKKYRKRKDVNG